MTTTKRRNANTVLAMQFGWDIGDLREQRYQDTRTNGAVYTIGDNYYCCVPLGKQPYQDRTSLVQWSWQPVESAFAKGEGFQIWKATGDAL